MSMVDGWMCHNMTMHLRYTSKVESTDGWIESTNVPLHLRPTGLYKTIKFRRTEKLCHTPRLMMLQIACPRAVDIRCVLMAA